MANDKKSTFSSFTASCLNNPFSKLSPRKRNIHTVHDQLPNDVSGHSNIGEGLGNIKDKKPAEEIVSKIVKLIPGLCKAKNQCPESSDCETCRNGSNITKNFLNDDGVIGVVPPKQTDCYTKGSGHRRKTTNNKPKVMMLSTNQPRLNIDRLNVKVSGPMHLILDKTMGLNIRKVVTLSGAGMSTSAGIPDFRSPNSGIYDRLKEYNLPYAQAIFERKYFDKNPKPLFALLKEMLTEDYKPTVAHYFVRLLEEKGLLLRHITQNVDGLERLAGVSQNKVVEAHGSVYGSRCLKCKTEYGLQWLRDRLVIQGKTVPQCQDPHCLGMVKPNIVLFGETLNPLFMASIKDDLPECDLLIIIGTSLVVEPFASTVKKVSRSCPRIVINNIPVGEHLGIVYEGSKKFNQKKLKSTLRDIFIQGSCDEGVMYLAKLFNWECDLEALIHRCEPELTLKPPPPNMDSAHRARLFSQVNESKEQTCSQTNPKKEKRVKSAEKDPRTVANRAKEMWKRLTSHVMRPESAPEPVPAKD